MNAERTNNTGARSLEFAIASPVEERAGLPLRASRWMGAEGVVGETGASRLVTSVLGRPEVHGTMAVWRVREFGRPCLVSLHTWSSGAQTVTIFDSSRPTYDAVINLVLDSSMALQSLERELQRLTTWREEADDGDPAA